MSDPASSISRIAFESRLAVSPAAARGEAVHDRMTCLTRGMAFQRELQNSSSSSGGITQTPTIQSGL